MTGPERDALMAWLRYCEAHPGSWERGEVEIPLHQAGLTLDEADELSGRPTLADVRRAIEARCAKAATGTARQDQ